MNLLVLAHLGAGDAASYTSKIELTLGSFAGRAAQAGRTVPMMLAALSSYHAGSRQVVIVGDRRAQDTAALLDVIRSRYQPTMLTMCIEPDGREAMAGRLAWVGALTARDGRATAYLCREFACQAPTSEPAELARQLEAR
jgi:hypothetical protein